MLGGAARLLASPSVVRLGIVAGSGLSPSDPFETWSPSPEEWNDFAEEVQRQRAWGIVAAAEGGRISIGPIRTPVVHAHVRALMVRAVALERATIEVVLLLRGAGIDVRVLKGPAAAHLLYPDPTVRPFSDVDLLVPSVALDRAVELVEALGGRRHRGERVAGSVALIGKGVGLTLANGVEVDLHRRLAQGPHQFGAEERVLFENPERITIGGCVIEAPSRPVAFVHACLHAVGAGDVRRVVPLRDVAQHLVDDPDLESVRRVARALSAEGTTAVAIVAANRLLGLQLPDSPLVRWALRVCAGASERMWIAIAERERPLPRSVLALASLAAQPDARHMAKYLQIQISGRAQRPNHR